MKAGTPAPPLATVFNAPPGLPEPEAALLAEGGAGNAVGFVELSIRPTAEGCRTNRVAYVEAWYVAPGARGTGVGRALIEAAEEWGRANGCEELASDTEIANETSAQAHLARGTHRLSVSVADYQETKNMEDVVNGATPNTRAFSTTFFVR